MEKPLLSAGKPIRLRGHHLLCTYGFRGLGYDEHFVANMAALVAGIRREPERLVEVGQGADDLCGACPHLKDGQCARNGAESAARVKRHDERVLMRLALEPGAVLSAGSLLAAVEDRIAPKDIAGLCEGCQWLALGYCEEGLRQATSQAGEVR